MKIILPFVIVAFSSTSLAAQESDPITEQSMGQEVFAHENETDLQQFIWKKRPVVVFADSPSDPRFIEQVELLKDAPADLSERDVVVLLDPNPGEMSPLRRKLRPRGFMLAILGKDGGVKLRKPFPWDVREITRSIDKMPMRKREMREEKRAAGSKN